MGPSYELMILQNSQKVRVKVQWTIYITEWVEEATFRNMEGLEQAGKYQLSWIQVLFSILLHLKVIRSL